MTRRCFLQWTRRLTVALDLPDGITHAPQCRHREEDGREVLGGGPDEKEDRKAELKDRSYSDESLGGHSTSENTYDHGEYEVGDAECDHVVTDVFDSQSARHVRLYVHTHTNTRT